ncbi:MAG: hypothetical protein KatS3mg081_1670 [Gemmatimonadales bacterium]|nr:MAG: hypothetical protein KatS3mg081_1670 [Gemmatimonadales bacterium]
MLGIYKGPLSIRSESGRSPPEFSAPWLEKMAGP